MENSYDRHNRNDRCKIFKKIHEFFEKYNIDYDDYIEICGMFIAISYGTNLASEEDFEFVLNCMRQSFKEAKESMEKLSKRHKQKR